MVNTRSTPYSSIYTTLVLRKVVTYSKTYNNWLNLQCSFECRVIIINLVARWFRRVENSVLSLLRALSWLTSECWYIWVILGQDCTVCAKELQNPTLPTTIATPLSLVAIYHLLFRKFIEFSCLQSVSRLKSLHCTECIATATVSLILNRTYDRIFSPINAGGVFGERW